MNRRRYLLMLIFYTLACSILTACLKQTPDPQQESLIRSDPDIHRALADTALEIQSMWAQLGRIEQSRDPGRITNLKEYPGGEVPEDLRQTLTLETWTGELGILARQLADKIDYHYVELGKRPGQPLIITLAADDQPIGEILRELGYLAGERAAIIVHGDKKRLEVVYYD